MDNEMYMLLDGMGNMIKDTFRYTQFSTARVKADILMAKYPTMVIYIVKGVQRLTASWETTATMTKLIVEDFGGN